MTGLRTVVVATGDARPSSVTWHTGRLLARIDRHPRARPRLLVWSEGPTPVERPPGCRAWSPAQLDDLPGVVALRRRAGAHAATAARTLLLRAWLARQARRPLVLDGAACAPIVGWATGRIAPTVWLLHPGEHPDLATLGADPARALRTLTELRVADRGQADELERVGAEPDRILVGADDAAFAPIPAAPTPILGLLGPPDADHGLDLALRLLAEVARRQPETQARWALPAGSTVPAEAGQELDRLGLTGRLSFAAPGDLAEWARDIRLLVLPWRVAADGPELRALRGAGRPPLGFGDDPDGVPFPDVEALAAIAARELVAPAADAADRRPPPSDLLDRLLGVGPKRGGSAIRRVASRAT